MDASLRLACGTQDCFWGSLPSCMSRGSLTSSCLGLNMKAATTLIQCYTKPNVRLSHRYYSPPRWETIGGINKPNVQAQNKQIHSSNIRCVTFLLLFTLKCFFNEFICIGQGSNFAFIIFGCLNPIQRDFMLAPDQRSKEECALKEQGGAPKENYYIIRNWSRRVHLSRV